MMTKVMRHADYQRRIRSLSESALRYTIRDCQAVLDAMPDNPNSGYYQDEIHYCAMELHRRKVAPKRGRKTVLQAA